MRSSCIYELFEVTIYQPGIIPSLVCVQAEGTCVSVSRLVFEVSFLKPFITEFHQARKFLPGESILFVEHCTV
jgi:hypothetical protein